MFTKQHYVAIAEIIKKSYNPAYQIIIGRELASRLVDYFESDNPLFDREKFLDACDVR